MIAQYMGKTGTPGLSVAVQVDDSLVWVEGFGLVDVEHNVPVQTYTKFRAGSVSKALTSIAVGLLHEQNRLNIDAPVQTYVPSFPEKEYPITTRQLGGHLSGLPNKQEDEYINVIPYNSVTEALDTFKDRPLLFPPGQRFYYSNFGYTLISAVIKGASGAPFLEYMRSSVFKPLGMTNTEADRYKKIIPHRTNFYKVTDDGVLQHATFTDNSDVWASGGLLSTPSDLVACGHGLLHGDLLEPETTELLFSRMKTANGEETTYGLGWMVEDDLHGHRSVFHTGGHFGASTVFLIFPDEHVIVAVMANAQHDASWKLTTDLADLFLQ